jgi:hypothetical protein
MPPRKSRRDSGGKSSRSVTVRACRLHHPEGPRSPCFLVAFRVKRRLLFFRQGVRWHDPGRIHRPLGQPPRSHPTHLGGRHRRRSQAIDEPLADARRIPRPHSPGACCLSAQTQFGPSRPPGRRRQCGAKQEKVRHGLHRWHDGHRLQEPRMEWAHLHVCLLGATNAYTQSGAQFSLRNFAGVRAGPTDRPRSQKQRLRRRDRRTPAGATRQPQRRAE